MAGVSLLEIQEILGHARPETTMRYRTVSLDRKRRALTKLMELRNQKNDPIRDSSRQTLPEWTESKEAFDWLERL